MQISHFAAAFFTWEILDVHCMYWIQKNFKDMLNDTMNVITHMKSMEIYEVVSYAKSLTKYKNEIYDFLDIIMVWYRDMLILKTTGL